MVQQVSMIANILKNIVVVFMLKVFLLFSLSEIMYLNVHESELYHMTCATPKRRNESEIYIYKHIAEESR